MLVLFSDLVNEQKKIHQNKSKSMNVKERPVKQSRHKNYGLPYWIHKLRPVLRTWSTRMHVTASRINKTWVQSVVPIFVRKSFSTHLQRKLLSVILPVSVCQSWSVHFLVPVVKPSFSILKNFVRLLRSWQEILIELLIATIILFRKPKPPTWIDGRFI